MKKSSARSRSRSRSQLCASAGDVVDVELLKAVAQAWHAQSGNPRRASSSGADDPTAGARARVGAAPRRPSRFKLEAMAAMAAAAAPDADARERSSSWDFAQSLWDPYELVAVARRLESGLVVADHASAATQEGDAPAGSESGRSLRKLLLRSTSKRFVEPS